MANLEILLIVILVLNIIVDLVYIFREKSIKIISIKYKDNAPQLVDLEKGDWIDLASPNSIVYKQGDLVQVDF